MIHWHLKILPPLICKFRTIIACILSSILPAIFHTPPPPPPPTFPLSKYLLETKMHQSHQTYIIFVGSALDVNRLIEMSAQHTPAPGSTKRDGRKRIPVTCSVSNVSSVGGVTSRPWHGRETGTPPLVRALDRVGSRCAEVTLGGVITTPSYVRTHTSEGGADQGVSVQTSSPYYPPKTSYDGLIYRRLEYQRPRWHDTWKWTFKVIS